MTATMNVQNISSLFRFTIVKEIVNDGLAILVNTIMAPMQAI